MEKNRLELLARKFMQGQCSHEELLELKLLIRQGNENAELELALEKIWKSCNSEQQMPSEMFDRIIRNTLEQPGSNITASTSHEHSADNPPKRNRRLFKPLSIAATVAFMIAASWWFISRKNTGRPEEHVVSTQKGSKSKMQLPDGSNVWLNAGSTLVYHGDFGKKSRNVELSGEAFFDVAHDSQKPFIIHTESMDLRVLGTTFNVRAYTEENIAEASLITGSIEVSFPGNTKPPMTLKPSEKISVDRRTSPANEPKKRQNNSPDKPAVAVSPITYQVTDSSVIETAWVKNRLVFRNKLFEEVAQEMSRWYNINFEFKDIALKNKRFTGTFENETAYEALRRLAQSYNFSFQYNREKKIFIIGK